MKKAALSSGCEALKSAQSNIRNAGGYANNREAMNEFILAVIAAVMVEAAKTAWKWKKKNPHR